MASERGRGYRRGLVAGERLGRYTSQHAFSDCNESGGNELGGGTVSPASALLLAMGAAVERGEGLGGFTLYVVGSGKK